MNTLEILKEKHYDICEKFNQNVKEIIEHQTPDEIALSEEQKLIAKISYIDNANNLLEIFIGNY